MTRAQTASAVAGSMIVEMMSRLKLAPSEKKNSTRKKSRNGFSFMVINRAMGLAARVMPAMNAPISRDSPSMTDTSATARHQAMASRKIYSWIWSKRWINLTMT